MEGESAAQRHDRVDTLGEGVAVLLDLVAMATLLLVLKGAFKFLKWTMCWWF